MCLNSGADLAVTATVKFALLDISQLDANSNFKSQFTLDFTAAVALQAGVTQNQVSDTNTSQCGSQSVTNM